MVARAYTVAFEGVEARTVEVQCAITPGVPAFSLVGLPDKAVSEARDRVRTALSSMAIALPSKRITVNLSPADLPKEGSHFDLPIALALLAALEIIPSDAAEGTTALGELSLDGTLIPVIGALPAAMESATSLVWLSEARDGGHGVLPVPAGALERGLDVALLVDGLREALRHERFTVLIFGRPRHDTRKDVEVALYTVAHLVHVGDSRALRAGGGVLARARVSHEALEQDDSDSPAG